MSTTTLTRSDVDGLSKLDFEHACRRRRLRELSSECGAKADWLLVKPCCGAITFVCDPHVDVTNSRGHRYCLDCHGVYVSAMAERHRL